MKRPGVVTSGEPAQGIAQQGVVSPSQAGATGGTVVRAGPAAQSALPAARSLPPLAPPRLAALVTVISAACTLP